MSDPKVLSNSPALRSGASYEYLKKQARKLQRAVRGDDGEALARVRTHHPRHGEALGAERRATFPLADAQLVVAREHGFLSWPKLKTAILALSRRAAEGAQLDALVSSVRAQLQRFARLTGRLSEGQQRLLGRSDDPQVLIDIAASCFDRAEREALLEHDQRLPRLMALRAGLERVMDGLSPVPVGSGDGAGVTAEEADACIVVLYAGGYAHLYGRRFPLSKEVTRIGRNLEQDIVFNSDSISRQHCTIERRGGDYHVVDQEATNHTFVNANPEPVASRRLQSGDRIMTGDAIMAFLQGDDLDARYREIVDYVAERDGLTELQNRRTWTASTAREVLYARGCERPLSMLMVDLDGLQELNQTLGHLAGNALLRDVAHALREICGPDAGLARHGGDVFAALLPGNDLASALELGERLRAAVDAWAPREPHPSRVERARCAMPATVSVGVSTLYRTTGADELIADAHAAMGRAKATGRNRVCGPEAYAA
ncbi:MAG: GGDEF domain-containing protein [Myxococcales bacterium]|nr:GGDEF domain-containing protein [Myxococcales bacterium]